MHLQNYNNLIPMIKEFQKSNIDFYYVQLYMYVAYNYILFLISLLNYLSIEISLNLNKKKIYLYKI